MFSMASYVPNAEYEQRETNDDCPPIEYNTIKSNIAEASENG